MMESDINTNPAAAVTADVADEDHQLISSARVEGTPVFDHHGQKIGTVHSVMIHKLTGQVAYAVLSFGGFLGIGSRVHPLPWGMLTYDSELNGYSLTVSREDIEDAPYMSLDEADRPRRTDEPIYRYWDKYI